MKRPLLYYQEADNSEQKIENPKPFPKAGRKKPTVTLSNLPKEVINIIADHLLYPRVIDQKGAVKKIPSKDLDALKTTSRHFYGKNPKLCYTGKYSLNSTQFFCYVAFSAFKFKDEAVVEPVSHFMCACCLISIAGVSCVLSIPACILGGLFGCMVDTKNGIKSVVRPRPDPDEGFIKIAGPPSQKMR